MADGSIISREVIRDKARKAFWSGLPRSAHEMNWHAAALPTWLAEYDRVAASIKHIPAVQAGVDAPQSIMEGA